MRGHEGSRDTCRGGDTDMTCWGVVCAAIPDWSDVSAPGYPAYGLLLVNLVETSDGLLQHLAVRRCAWQQKLVPTLS